MTVTMDQLSPVAQQIIQLLEDEARFHAMSKGNGWAQVDEDKLKRIDGIGLGENPPIDAGKLEAYEPTPIRVAIAELRRAGVGISVSKGAWGRIVSLDNVRISRDQLEK